jgi:hypothetical protein
VADPPGLLGSGRAQRDHERRRSRRGERRAIPAVCGGPEQHSRRSSETVEQRRGPNRAVSVMNMRRAAEQVGETAAPEAKDHQCDRSAARPAWPRFAASRPRTGQPGSSLLLRGADYRARRHDEEWRMAESQRRYGGITLGGIIVIVGIVLMFVWSFWVGLIIALVGLIAFGGFARGKWY